MATEEKPKKAKKGKSGWLVLDAGGTALYDGTDKVKARTAAADAINGGGTVRVLRISRQVTLGSKSLEVALPRNAF